MDSPLADNVAAELQAVKIPGIGMGDSLAHLATALDQDPLSVKVVFTDYQSEAGPWGQCPAEIKALLLLPLHISQKLMCRKKPLPLIAVKTECTGKFLLILHKV